MDHHPVRCAVTVQVASVTVHWASYTNEDIGEAEPDSGWYVTLSVGDADHDIGPDFYGPGHQTLDEALAAVRKWAKGRGLRVETKFFELPVHGP